MVAEVDRQRRLADAAIAVHDDVGTFGDQLRVGGANDRIGAVLGEGGELGGSDDENACCQLRTIVPRPLAEVVRLGRYVGEEGVETLLMHINRAPLSVGLAAPPITAPHARRTERHAHVLGELIGLIRRQPVAADRARGHSAHLFPKRIHGT